MRKRSTEILEKLILSNSKSLEVNKLITTYRISLKTLRTDVNEINDFLAEAKMSPAKLNEKELTHKPRVNNSQFQRFKKD